MKEKNYTFTVNKKQILAAAATMLGILFLTLGSVAIYFDIRIDNLDKKMENGYTAAISVSSGVSVYILREYEGKIGIFSSESKTPQQLLDVYVFTLPEADRIALRSGIRVYSSDALRSLIEDFTA